MEKISSLQYSGTKLEQKLFYLSDAHQVKNMNIRKGSHQYGKKYDPWKQTILAKNKNTLKYCSTY